MKVALKEFESLTDAYRYADEMTMKGCEILEFSPSHSGSRVLLKLSSNVQSSDVLELSDTILKAYLGLNNGKTKKYICVIEFQSLLQAFRLSMLAESKNCLVHEIRALRGINKSHHLILSHDQKEELSQLSGNSKAHIFSLENRALCEFLGFSNITIQ